MACRCPGTANAELIVRAVNERVRESGLRVRDHAGKGKLMPWIVEIDQGAINWTPIALCHSKTQAEDLSAAPHIVGFGKPVRVREQWKPAIQQLGKET